MRAALFFILGIVFVVFYIKYIETYAIYIPVKGIEYTPEVSSLTFEDVYINTDDDVKINGWFIPADDATYTVLFCHGNGGNIGHRLEKLQFLHSINLATFIIDYRGYGMSQGRPSEKGLYLDAKAAYNYLVKDRNINPERIVLYGESLGTAVVVEVASHEKVAGIILEGSFSRGRDMAKIAYPFLPAFFFADSFNSLSRINKIDVPKLFIHSRDDEVVPLSLAEKLYNAAEQPKEFVMLRGGHNNAFFDCQDEYISSIKSFTDKQLKEVVWGQ